MRHRIIGALDTGCRLSELANIRIADVNFQTWEIRLRSTKGQTKTGEEERVFAMTERLRSVLTQRRFLKGPDDYVFGREDGKQQKT